MRATNELMHRARGLGRERDAVRAVLSLRLGRDFDRCGAQCPAMTAEALTRRSRLTCIRLLDDGRVAIRRGATINVFHHRHIRSAHSAGNSTLINTRDGEIRLHQPLNAVLEDLDSIGLIQIHRSTAVNLTAVRQLVGCGQHRVRLRLDDDSWLDVGRQFQRTVRAHFASAFSVVLAARE